MNLSFFLDSNHTLAWWIYTFTMLFGEGFDPNKSEARLRATFTEDGKWAIVAWSGGHLEKFAKFSDGTQSEWRKITNGYGYHSGGIGWFVYTPSFGVFIKPANRLTKERPAFEELLIYRLIPSKK